MTEATELFSLRRDHGLKSMRIIALFLAGAIFATCTADTNPGAFYQSAVEGAMIVEALGKYPGWEWINVAKQFSDKPYDSHGGHDACGYVKMTRERKMLFHPLPEGPESVHSNVQDVFRVHPQLFATCPVFSVTYRTFMFSRETVDVQVDASGRIVLAKEPRYWD